MKLGAGTILWTAISILFVRWKQDEDRLLARDMARIEKRGPDAGASEAPTFGSRADSISRRGTAGPSASPTSRPAHPSKASMTMTTSSTRRTSTTSRSLASLTPEEHRRLARNLEALLEGVRQLADFLARTDPEGGAAKPG